MLTVMSMDVDRPLDLRLPANWRQESRHRHNGDAFEGVEVLVIEDSPTISNLMEFWLHDGQAAVAGVRRAKNLAEARTELATKRPDLILLDLTLSDCEGLATFRAVQSQSRGTPIIIMGTEVDEESAVAAVREGAQDYVVKSEHIGNPLIHPVRLALERIRRQQLEGLLRNADEQLAIAQSVQEHLYPDHAPNLPGFDIAGFCIAGEGIAGDYFDYLPLDNGVGIVVGDVMGHGYDAALVMAGVRGVLRALALNYTDLGELLSQANKVLAPDLSERFVTALFATIDVQKRTLYYAAAGHAGFLLDHEGFGKERLQATAPPLGVGDGKVHMAAPVPLSQGDLLLLYTDGIAESCASNGAVFGDEGVLEIVRACRHLPAVEIVERILQAARAFSGISPQLDDMTVVVAKVL